MKRKLMTAGTALLIAVLCVTMFLEGGFRISRLKADELAAALPQGQGWKAPAKMEGFGQPDVAVLVFENEEPGNYLVVEYSRNPVLRRYAPTAFHVYEDPREPEYDVVSSALYNHVYIVDWEAETVEVLKPEWREELWMDALVMALLVGGAVVIFRRPKQETPPL